MEVLDHGFIELIDIMGDDAEPANAARLSYGNTDARPWDLDERLTRYLWENHHTSPFEMVELKWRVKCPIFVARQWLRHRTASVNEFSMRYADPTKISDEGIDYYVPEEWRHSSKTNKQGSVPWTDGDQGLITANYKEGVEASILLYKNLQQWGVANELARCVLPVSVYTEFIWKNDLKNTLDFLRQRSDDHAQWEIQEYARSMQSLMRTALPRLMNIVESTWSEASATPKSRALDVA